MLTKSCVLDLKILEFTVRFYECCLSLSWVNIIPVAIFCADEGMKQPAIRLKFYSNLQLFAFEEKNVECTRVFIFRPLVTKLAGPSRRQIDECH